MNYKVDFWSLTRGAVEISSGRDYMGEFPEGKEDTIYMEAEDFFDMIESFSEVRPLREAWKTLRELADDHTIKLIESIEGMEEFQDINFYNEEESDGDE